MTDCQAEATETQIWIEFAVECQYLDTEPGRKLYKTYDRVLGQLVSTTQNAPTWLIE
ncbi:MAG: four helix bundle protein [Leptolyngbyaceae cyanobacterium bins.349]|nr:four helix bundle protein [Leptolyngbyaceae cyanobacterium bins.349]